ncbi:unnamed protein product [marine sediment metagenome]|uniref:Uncharacterized protein n=1 Tax=marine sediment metagenome TaxID=412755 RepID=X1RAF9_9ZZZZ
MSISEGTLQGYQDEARQLADDLAIVTSDLTGKELTRFGRSYSRQFVRALPTRAMADIHIRHIKEGLLGAMIAKSQMKAEIQGETPGSNKVGGPLPIRACYLGVGEDWEDIDGIYDSLRQTWAPGTAQNWIHAGTRLMGSVAASVGNAVRIGENAVHVIYGLSSIHASPKLESVQFTIDGKTKPSIYCGWAQKHAMGHTQRIKELDNAIILREDTTFKAEVFFSRAFGATVTEVLDFPVLYGVSYVKEPAMRELVPVAATWSGAVFEIVHRT